MSQPTYNNQHKPQHRQQQRGHRDEDSLDYEEPEVEVKTRQMPRADRQQTIFPKLIEQKTRHMPLSDRNSQHKASSSNRETKTSKDSIENPNSKLKGFLPDNLVPQRFSNNKEVENKQAMLKDNIRNSKSKDIAQGTSPSKPKQPLSPQNQARMLNRLENDLLIKENSNRQREIIAKPKLSENRPTNSTKDRYNSSMSYQPTRQMPLADRNTPKPLSGRNQDQRRRHALPSYQPIQNFPSPPRHQRIHKESRADRNTSQSSPYTQTTYTDEQDKKLASRQLQYNSLSPNEQRKQDEWAQQKLILMGTCPVGFIWIRVHDYHSPLFGGSQGPGYRCAAGAHFISDKELVEGVPAGRRMGLSNWMSGGSGSGGGLMLNQLALSNRLAGGRFANTGGLIGASRGLGAGSLLLLGAHGGLNQGFGAFGGSGNGYGGGLNGFGNGGSGIGLGL